MKKSIKIAIVLIVIIAAIGTGVLMSLSNKEKVSMTALEFGNTMKQKGFEIKDANSQFSQYDQIKQVYLAINGNYTYQIEFYELSDEANAISFYNDNASRFQSTKGNSSSETNVNGKNFSKYTLTSGGKYMVVSRINNTVIYLNVADNYKDEVKTILDELGY